MPDSDDGEYNIPPALQQELIDRIRRRRDEAMLELLRPYQMRIVDGVVQPIPRLSFAGAQNVATNADDSWLRGEWGPILDPNLDAVRNTYTELMRRAARQLTLSEQLMFSERYVPSRYPTPLPPKGKEVVEIFKFNDIYSVYQLGTGPAIVEEGQRMSNCLATRSEYQIQVARGLLTLFSLRTDGGTKSRATVGVVYERHMGQHYILELFGKRNSLVGKRFQPALNAFFKKHQIKFHSITRGGFAK